MSPFAALSIHQRRVRPDHLQQHRRVILHYALGECGIVLPLHQAGHQPTDQGSIVGSGSFCDHLCVPDRGSLLRCAVRGRYGRAANPSRHSRVLRRCGVEGQTESVRKCTPMDDAVLPKDVDDGERGTRYGGMNQ